MLAEYQCYPNPGFHQRVFLTFGCNWLYLSLLVFGVLLIIGGICCVACRSRNQVGDDADLEHDAAPIHHQAEAVTTTAAHLDGKPGGSVAVNVKSAGAPRHPRCSVCVPVTHQGSRIRAERRVAHAVS
jgi:hypothetical protein